MEGISASCGSLCYLTTYCKQIHSLYLKSHVIPECRPLPYFLCSLLLILFTRWFSVFKMKCIVSYHEGSLCYSLGNILILSGNRCIFPNSSDTTLWHLPKFLKSLFIAFAATISSHLHFSSYTFPKECQAQDRMQELRQCVCHQALMTWHRREFLPFLVSRATEGALLHSTDMTSWKLLPQQRLVHVLFLPCYSVLSPHFTGMAAVQQQLLSISPQRRLVEPLELLSHLRILSLQSQ